MSDRTIRRVVDGQDKVSAETVNQYFEALGGAIVPRKEGEGHPSASGGDLGSAIYPWRRLYVNEIIGNIGDGTNPIVNVISGVEVGSTESEGEPTWIVPNGPDGVMLLATPERPVVIKRPNDDDVILTSNVTSSGGTLPNFPNVTKRFNTSKQTETDIPFFSPERSPYYYQSSSQIRGETLYLTKGRFWLNIESAGDNPARGNTIFGKEGNDYFYFHVANETILIVTEENDLPDADTVSRDLIAYVIDEGSYYQINSSAWSAVTNLDLLNIPSQREYFSISTGDLNIGTEDNPNQFSTLDIPRFLSTSSFTQITTGYVFYNTSLNVNPVIIVPRILPNLSEVIQDSTETFGIIGLKNGDIAFSLSDSIWYQWNGSVWQSTNLVLIGICGIDGSNGVVCVKPLRIDFNKLLTIHNRIFSNSEYPVLNIISSKVSDGVNLTFVPFENSVQNTTLSLGCQDFSVELIGLKTHIDEADIINDEFYFYYFDGVKVIPSNLRPNPLLCGKKMIFVHPRKSQICIGSGVGRVESSEKYLDTNLKNISSNDRNYPYLIPSTISMTPEDTFVNQHALRATVTVSETINDTVSGLGGTIFNVISLSQVLPSDDDVRPTTVVDFRILINNLELFDFKFDYDNIEFTDKRLIQFVAGGTTYTPSDFPITNTGDSLFTSGVSTYSVTMKLRPLESPVLINPLTRFAVLNRTPKKINFSVESRDTTYSMHITNSFFSGFEITQIGIGHSSTGFFPIYTFNASYNILPLKTLTLI